MRGIFQGTVFGLKGIILGMQQGLINDETLRLSDKCFGSEKINEDLTFMAEFAARKGSLWDVVTFTTTARDTIINEMENCRFTTTVSLLQEYCHSHEFQEETEEDSWRSNAPDKFDTQDFKADWDKANKTRCSKPKMIENFYMRYFNFNGSFFRMMNIYSSWNPQNHNDTYLQMVAFGREIGKMTRILFDFHLTDEAKEIVSREYFSDL